MFLVCITVVPLVCQISFDLRQHCFILPWYFIPTYCFALVLLQGLDAPRAVNKGRVMPIYYHPYGKVGCLVTSCSFFLPQV